jgi:hypothetical protein
MGAFARNMYSDPAEIKPAQCCVKLVFHLTDFFITMTISRQQLPVQYRTDQKQLKNVEYFIYLDRIVTNDARCTCEINLLEPELFFFILVHPVYKMLII